MLNYHVSFARRKLKALWTWTKQERPAIAGSERKEFFHRCVLQLVAIPDVDAMEGDPVVEEGPLQQMPRQFFVGLWFWFKRKRVRAALCRQSWPTPTWNRWCTLRSDWQKVDDEEFAQLPAERRSDIEEYCARVPDDDEESSSESSVASDADDRPSAAPAPGAVICTAVTVHTVWTPAASSSSSWLTSWWSDSSWWTGQQNMERGDADWRGAGTDCDGGGSGSQSGYTATAEKQPSFDADTWDYKNAKEDVAALKDRSGIPRVLDRASDAWPSERSAVLPGWTPSADGRYAWNDIENKPLKHAYRTEGVRHVEHIQGRKFLRWKAFCERFQFSLGGPLDRPSSGVEELLRWMRQRPALECEVESLSVADGAVDQVVLSCFTGAAPGVLWYVKLKGGARESGDVRSLPPGHEWGYHATSMYCLSRAVVNRKLSSGPGQLRDKSDAPFAAVYYHRTKNAYLCLGSYNHYLALGGGPWLFAPVLILDVTEHPHKPDGTMLKSTVRGQGLTYDGFHKVVGLYVHILHAAELRFATEADFSAIVEGAWTPALELPVDGTWDELKAKSWKMRADPLL